MAQEKGQVNAELEKQVADFIKNYLASDNWKDDNANVKTALEGLKDEKSAFAVEFCKQYDERFKSFVSNPTGDNRKKFSKEIQKIVEKGGSLKLKIHFFELISSLIVTLGARPSISDINLDKIQDKTEKDNIVLNVEVFTIFKDTLNSALKRENIKEVLADCLKPQQLAGIYMFTHDRVARDCVTKVIKIVDDKELLEAINNKRYDLHQLSTEISKLSKELARSAVGGRHIYEATPGDANFFQLNIIHLFFTPTVVKDPSSLTRLFEDMVKNPGSEQNKKLIEDLSKDIMEKSKDMIQGMSKNPLYRVLQNIYNFCAAIYHRDPSIFTKGSVVLDGIKFKPNEKVDKSFADKIEAEVAKRATTPAVEGEKKAGNFAERVQQGRLPTEGQKTTQR